MLESMLSEMAEVYRAGMESGQCEVALKEQIRTAFMSIFKMDLLTATSCTEKVVQRHQKREWRPREAISRYGVPDWFKMSRLKSIQNALSH